MPANVPVPVRALSLGYRYDGAAGDTLRPGEVFSIADGTGGAVELPPARDTGGSLVLCLAPTDGTELKITASAGDLIDDSPTYTLALPQRSQMLVSLGGLGVWRLL